VRTQFENKGYLLMKKIKFNRSKMKKFIISLAIMFGMGVMTYANATSVSAVDDKEFLRVTDYRNFDFKFSDEEIKHLNLDNDIDKTIEFRNFHKKFCDGMFYAKTINKANKKERYIINCIKNELRDMEMIFNKRQYHDFLVLLNVKLYNHNFNTKDIADEIQKNY
jgi:hypothetical protein